MCSKIEREMCWVMHTKTSPSKHRNAQTIISTQYFQIISLHCLEFQRLEFFWCEKSKLKRLITKGNNISIELINTTVVPISVLAWYWKLGNIPENNEIMNNDTSMELE